MKKQASKFNRKWLPKPYHQQEGEGNLEFSAFKRYRNLFQEERTAEAMEKIAMLCERKVSTLQQWSYKFLWAERAAAYDAEQERQTRWRQYRQVDEMNKRQTGLGKSCQALAMKELKKLMAAVDGDPDMLLTPAQIIQIASFGVTAERVALGEPNAIVEQKEENNDLSRLSVSELKALKEIKKKLRRPE